MKQQSWKHNAVRAIVVVTAALSFSAWAEVPSFKEAPAASGDREFCLDKTDGTYEHPDCRMRYSCKRGIASQVACPSGQVFDAAKNPDDKAGLSYCSAPEAMSHLDCTGISLVK